MIHWYSWNKSHKKSQKKSVNPKFPPDFRSPIGWGKPHDSQWKATCPMRRSYRNGALLVTGGHEFDMFPEKLVMIDWCYHWIWHVPRKIGHDWLVLSLNLTCSQKNWSWLTGVIIEFDIFPEKLVMIDWCYHWIWHVPRKIGHDWLVLSLNLTFSQKNWSWLTGVIIEFDIFPEKLVMIDWCYHWIWHVPRKIGHDWLVLSLNLTCSQKNWSWLTGVIIEFDMFPEKLVMIDWCYHWIWHVPRKIGHDWLVLSLNLTCSQKNWSWLTGVIIEFDMFPEKLVMIDWCYHWIWHVPRKIGHDWLVLSLNLTCSQKNWSWLTGVIIEFDMFPEKLVMIDWCYHWIWHFPRKIGHDWLVLSLNLTCSQKNWSWLTGVIIEFDIFPEKLVMIDWCYHWIWHFPRKIGHDWLVLSLNLTCSQKNWSWLTGVIIEFDIFPEKLVMIDWCYHWIWHVPRKIGHDWLVLSLNLTCSQKNWSWLTGVIIEFDMFPEKLVMIDWCYHWIWHVPRKIGHDWLVLSLNLTFSQKNWSWLTGVIIEFDMFPEKLVMIDWCYHWIWHFPRKIGHDWLVLSLNLTCSQKNWSWLTGVIIEFDMFPEKLVMIDWCYHWIWHVPRKIGHDWLVLSLNLTCSQKNWSWLTGVIIEFDMFPEKLVMIDWCYHWIWHVPRKIGHDWLVLSLNLTFSQKNWSWLTGVIIEFDIFPEKLVMIDWCYHWIWHVPRKIGHDWLVLSLNLTFSQKNWSWLTGVIIEFDMFPEKLVMIDWCYHWIWHFPRKKIDDVVIWWWLTGVIIEFDIFPEKLMMWWFDDDWLVLSLNLTFSQKNWWCGDLMMIDWCYHWIWHFPRKILMMWWFDDDWLVLSLNLTFSQKNWWCGDLMMIDWCYHWIWHFPRKIDDVVIWWWLTGVIIEFDIFPEKFWWCGDLMMIDWCYHWIWHFPRKILMMWWFDDDWLVLSLNLTFSQKKFDDVVIWWWLTGVIIEFDIFPEKLMMWWFDDDWLVLSLNLTFSQKNFDDVVIWWWLTGVIIEFDIFPEKFWWCGDLMMIDWCYHWIWHFPRKILMMWWFDDDWLVLSLNLTFSQKNWWCGDLMMIDWCYHWIWHFPRKIDDVVIWWWLTGVIIEFDIFPEKLMMWWFDDDWLVLSLNLTCSQKNWWCGDLMMIDWCYHWIWHFPRKILMMWWFDDDWLVLSLNLTFSQKNFDDVVIWWWLTGVIIEFDIFPEKLMMWWFDDDWLVLSLNLTCSQKNFDDVVIWWWLTGVIIEFDIFPEKLMMWWFDDDWLVLSLNLTFSQKNWWCGDLMMIDWCYHWIWHFPRKIDDDWLVLSLNLTCSQKNWWCGDLMMIDWCYHWIWHVPRKIDDVVIWWWLTGVIIEFDIFPEKFDDVVIWWWLTGVIIEFDIFPEKLMMWWFDDDWLVLSLNLTCSQKNWWCGDLMMIDWCYHWIWHFPRKIDDVVIWWWLTGVIIEFDIFPEKLMMWWFDDDWLVLSLNLTCSQKNWWCGDLMMIDWCYHWIWHVPRKIDDVVIWWWLTGVIIEFDIFPEKLMMWWFDDDWLVLSLNLTCSQKNWWCGDLMMIDWCYHWIWHVPRKIDDVVIWWWLTGVIIEFDMFPEKLMMWWFDDDWLVLSLNLTCSQKNWWCGDLMMIDWCYHWIWHVPRKIDDVVIWWWLTGVIIEFDMFPEKLMMWWFDDDWLVLSLNLTCSQKNWWCGDLMMIDWCYHWIWHFPRKIDDDWLVLSLNLTFSQKNWWCGDLMMIDWCYHWIWHFPRKIDDDWLVLSLNLTFSQKNWWCGDLMMIDWCYHWIWHFPRKIDDVVIWWWLTGVIIEFDMFPEKLMMWWFDDDWLVLSLNLTCSQKNWWCGDLMMIDWCYHWIWHVPRKIDDVVIWWWLTGVIIEFDMFPEKLVMIDWCYHWIWWYHGLIQWIWLVLVVTGGMIRISPIDEAYFFRGVFPLAQQPDMNTVQTTKQYSL